MMRRLRGLATIAVAATLTACGSEDGRSDGTVTVFAASSLTEAFTEIGAVFSSSHPDARVTFNFGASSTLATQIVNGAPADVFAPADTVQMGKVADARRVGADEARIFATNVLEIVVAAGNPKGVSGPADLARRDLIVVLAAPEVPIGAYSADVLRAAGVAAIPASFEENVKAVVNKVTLGEADAGIVYSTDVVAAGDTVDGVPIPADANVVAEYPIATLVDAADTDAADEFVELVLGGQGQAVLAEYGFGRP